MESNTETAAPAEPQDLDDVADDAQGAATSAPTTPRSELRYPLAFDVNGNPLQVPAHAVAWRVRRGGGKRGRPRNVFDSSSGRQLEIALGSSIDDLANTGVKPDRYLLYPVDEQGTIIPGIIAVTELTDEDGDERDDDDGAIGTALAPVTRDPLTLMVTHHQQQINSYDRTLAEVVGALKGALVSFQESLGKTVSGYAPVAPPPAPPVPQLPMAAEHVLPPAAPPAPDMLTSLVGLLSKPDVVPQLGMIFGMAINAIKSAMANNAATAGGVVGGGAVSGAP